MSGVSNHNSPARKTLSWYLNFKVPPYFLKSLAWLLESASKGKILSETCLSELNRVAYCADASKPISN